VRQNAKLLIAFILAPALALSLLGTSYILFPDRTDQMPEPIPEPSMFVQISSALFWIGIALAIAVSVAGVILFVGRVQRKKESEGFNER
jgi:hypothetical protein